MSTTQADQAKAKLRAGVYARLSETYDAAESVPTQLERGTEHAQRRDWQVVATFKDDGYSAFKEITRDGFGELIAAIEADQVNVVIVRDIDRLTRTPRRPPAYSADSVASRPEPQGGAADRNAFTNLPAPVSPVSLQERKVTGGQPVGRAQPQHAGAVPHGQ